MTSHIKKGLSLVELIIVVAVLGILASVVVPQFTGYSTQAKTSVAKDNLKTFRGAIELYCSRNEGLPPGYPGNNPLNTPDSSSLIQQLTSDIKYIQKIPKNPFNNLTTILVLANNAVFPSSPVDGFGWIYQPATMQIRLNWDGTDPNGQQYFDY